MKKTVKKAVKKAVKTQAAKPKAAAKKTAAKKAPAPKKAAAPKAAKSKKQESTNLNLIIKSIDQDKGTDIISIDLAGKTAIADYMVIATGTSSRHVGAMAEKLKDRLNKEGVRVRIEGKHTGDWVIVDSGDVLVHLFRQEVRDFYDLEHLWGADFSTVDYIRYTSN